MIQTVWHISFKKRCIDKEPCIFALVDHLVQELNDRLLSQENRFLGQYPFPAKLNTFNSRVQNKLYKTYKTDLSKKRELILTMEFQGGKQSGLIQLMKNQSHISQSHRSSTLIRAFIPAWSQLLPSSWQCRCQLLPPNNLLAQYAEWRRVYVLRWKHSDSKHLPWCMLTETYPLM